MTSDREQLLAQRWLPDQLAYHLDPTNNQRWPHTQLLGRRIRDLIMGVDPYQIWTFQPQAGKTTGIRGGVVWGLDWFPHLRFIWVSHRLDLARINAKKVRDLFRDNPDQLRTQLAADSTRADFWETSEGGGLLAAGVNTGIAGFPGDVFLVDDPHKDRREAQSAHMREIVWQWYLSDVLQRLQDETRVLVCQTRWHEDDLTGRLLEQSTLPWSHLHVPALADPAVVDPDPLGRDPGQPIRERFSLATMAARRAEAGPYNWAALYQGTPSAVEGSLLKRSWWRWLDAAPTLQTRAVTITSWDLTLGSTSDTASYVVGQCWTRTTDGRYVILDQIRERMEYPETRTAVLQFAAQHRDATHHVIEKSVNAHAFSQEIGTSLPGLTLISPIGSKTDRAERVTGLLADGRVYLPGWLPDGSWPDTLINEAADFPTGRHDDQVDAATQALEFLRQPGAGATIEMVDERLADAIL